MKKHAGEVYARYHAQSLGPSLEELDLALEIDPMDGRAYHRRAWAFEEKGDAERAAADYREALKLLGKDDYLRGVIEERLRALSQ